MNINSTEEEKRPFTLTNPQHLLIYKKLGLISPGAQSFFMDACRIMHGEEHYEATTNLVGQCIREIESAIRESLESLCNIPTEKNITFLNFLEESLELDDVHEIKSLLLTSYYDFERGNRKMSHKEQIRAILSAFNIDESHPIATLWIRESENLSKYAHRKGLSHLRQNDEQFTLYWLNMQKIFHYILKKYQENYSEVLDKLEKYILKEAPTIEDAKYFKTKFPNNEVVRKHFFDEIQSCKWIKPLRESGFFDSPPDLVSDASGMRCATWPQSQYLARMAKHGEVQSVILEIVLRTNTSNSIIHADFLDVALELQPVLAKKIVAKCITWNLTRSWGIAEKIGKFISHLTQGDCVNDAFRLLEHSLSLLPDPRYPQSIGEITMSPDPQSYFDEWNYEKILTNQLPDLISEDGDRAISVLMSLLNQATELSLSEQKESKHRDYSTIWRRAIEDHKQNHKHGYRDLLVTALREAIEAYLQTHPVEAMSVIDKLHKYSWQIFERVELHTLRLFPEHSVKEIGACLTNKKFYRSERFVHEFYLLAQKHVNLLSPDEKTIIWQLIKSGATKKYYEDYFIQNNFAYTAKDLGNRVKIWQLNHLVAYKSLGGKWQEWYKKLESEVGKPEKPEFQSWSSGGSFGPESAIDYKSLEEMNIDELLMAIKSFKPSEDPIKSSREGLGRQLTTLVSSRPLDFADIADIFIDLHPTFVRSIIRGFEEAVKANIDISWDKILILCKWVVEQPVEKKEVQASFFTDQGWSWSRNSIVDLLSAGYKNRKYGMPMEYRFQSWSILEILTNDPDPTLERECKSEKSESGLNPETIAINSIRGDAMHAVIDYGLWILHHYENEEKEISFDKIPELQEVLENHLDINNDSSLAIRSVYGQRLPWLVLMDKDWVKQNLDKIFPKEQELLKYRRAAWDAYITFCRPYKNVFPVLAEEYKQSIDEIGKHQRKTNSIHNDDERLAQHLMALYLQGNIDYGTGNSDLIYRFFEKTTDIVAATAIRHVGHILSDNKDLPKKLIENAKKLWVRRLAYYRNNVRKSVEMNGFGWWFSTSHFSNEWLLSQLEEVLQFTVSIEPNHLIAEKLCDLADKYSLQSIACLELLVKQEQRDWGMQHIKDEVLQIIKIIRTCDDKMASKRADILGNKLLSERDITPSDWKFITQD